jgi:hypothetical protein
MSSRIQDAAAARCFLCGSARFAEEYQLEEFTDAVVLVMGGRRARVTAA